MGYVTGLRTASVIWMVDVQDTVYFIRLLPERIVLVVDAYYYDVTNRHKGRDRAASKVDSRASAALITSMRFEEA